MQRITSKTACISARLAAGQVKRNIANIAILKDPHLQIILYLSEAYQKDKYDFDAYEVMGFNVGKFELLKVEPGAPTDNKPRAAL